MRWDTYDLVVIDESHNFRNGGKLDSNDERKDNRYATLFKQVIRKGVKTKVLMLSATPVNTRFNDLKNQLQLAYEGDSSNIDEKLKTERSIDDNKMENHARLLSSVNVGVAACLPCI